MNWLKRLFGKPKMKEPTAQKGTAKVRRFDADNLEVYYLDPKFYGGHTDLTLTPNFNRVVFDLPHQTITPFSFPDYRRWN